MKQILTELRNRFHPLFHLRKLGVFRKLASQTPITVSRKFHRTRVYCDLFKDASFVVLPDAPEYESFVDVVSRLNAKCFWDIGANIGAYSWTFLDAVRDGAAVLFEPDSRNGELIRKTITRNNLNASYFGGAVAAFTGVSSFYADRFTGATGSLVKRIDGYDFVERHFGDKTSQIEVPVTTIDEQAARLAIPDVIKINVMARRCLSSKAA